MLPYKNSHRDAVFVLLVLSFFFFNNIFIFRVFMCIYVILDYAKSTPSNRRPPLQPKLQIRAGQAPKYITNSNRRL